MNNISIIVPSVTIHYIHDKAKTFDLHNFLTIDFQATDFYSNFNFIVHFIFHPFSSPLFSFLSLSTLPKISPIPFSFSLSLVPPPYLFLTLPFLFLPLHYYLSSLLFNILLPISHVIIMILFED